ncbi:MAG: hypothetical protein ACSHX7_09520 [Luteolibacter sp.]
MLILLGLLCSLNSCVPLAIGAVGVAVGYIARDEKFGLSPEAEDDDQVIGYSDTPAPTYESYPANPSSSPATPSYDAAPQFSDDVDMPVY